VPYTGRSRAIAKDWRGSGKRIGLYFISPGSKNVVNERSGRTPQNAAYGAPKGSASDSPEIASETLCLISPVSRDAYDRFALLLRMFLRMSAILSTILRSGYRYWPVVL